MRGADIAHHAALLARNIWAYREVLMNQETVEELYHRNHLTNPELPSEFQPFILLVILFSISAYLKGKGVPAWQLRPLDHDEQSGLVALFVRAQEIPTAQEPPRDLIDHISNELSGVFVRPSEVSELRKEIFERRQRREQAQFPELHGASTVQRKPIVLDFVTAVMLIVMGTTGGWLYAHSTIKRPIRYVTSPIQDARIGAGEMPDNYSAVGVYASGSGPARTSYPVGRPPEEGVLNSTSDAPVWQNDQRFLAVSNPSIDPQGSFTRGTVEAKIGDTLQLQFLVRNSGKKPVTNVKVVAFISHEVDHRLFAYEIVLENDGTIPEERAWILVRCNTACRGVYRSSDAYVPHVTNLAGKLLYKLPANALVTTTPTAMIGSYKPNGVIEHSADVLVNFSMAVESCDSSC